MNEQIKQHVTLAIVFLMTGFGTLSFDFMPWWSSLGFILMGLHRGWFAYVNRIVSPSEASS